jgi:hypothetical protein
MLYLLTCFSHSLCIHITLTRINQVEKSNRKAADQSDSASTVSHQG